MNSLSFNKINSEALTNVLNKFYEYKKIAHSKITPVLAKWSEAMPSWKPSTSANGQSSPISKKNPTSQFPNAAPLLGTLAVLGMAALYLKSTPGTPLNSQGGAQTNLVLNPANTTMKDDLSLLDRHLEIAPLSVEPVNLTSSTLGSYPELMSSSNVSTLFSSVEYNTTTTLVETTPETACENDTSPSNFSLPSGSALSSVSLKTPLANAEENERSVSKPSLPAESPRSNDDLLEATARIVLEKAKELSPQIADTLSTAVEKAKQISSAFLYILSLVAKETEREYGPYVNPVVKKTKELIASIVDNLSAEKAKELPAQIVDTLGNMMPTYPGLKIGGALGIVLGSKGAKNKYDLASRKISLTSEFIKTNLVTIPVCSALGYVVEKTIGLIPSIVDTLGNLMPTYPGLKIGSALGFVQGTSIAKSNVVEAGGKISFIKEFFKTNLVTIPLFAGIGFGVEQIVQFINSEIANPSLGTKIGAGVGAAFGTITAKPKHTFSQIQDYFYANALAIPICSGLGYFAEKTVTTVNSLFWSIVNVAGCPFIGSFSEKFTELGYAALNSVPLDLVIAGSVYPFPKKEKSFTSLSVNSNTLYWRYAGGRYTPTVYYTQ